MDPFEQNVNHPIPSHEFDPLQKSGGHADNKHNEDFNDYFSHKPGKINDTIDFLNAETGRAHEVVSDLSKPASKIDNLVDNLGDISSGIDEVSGKSHDVFSKGFDESDLLGLSESVVNHTEPTLEPIKPDPSHVLPASDNVKDLLFDEKEQDELKGFDQYTSDSNASLKVNLSCENDDTASTKSIDSAQSIPLDEKKNLLKENLIEDASEILSKISEDTLVPSPELSNPIIKDTKSLVDSFESDFPSQDIPQPAIDVAVKPTPSHQEAIHTEKEISEDVPKMNEISKEKEVTKEEEVPKLKEVKKEVAKSEPVAPKAKIPPVKKAVSTEMFIGPHEVFSRFGLVESLVYWRDPKLSGAVFGVSLAVLISLAYYSLISVVANLALLVLVGAIGFRIYKTILQAVQKTSEGHPFKPYLELDISLPADKVRTVAEASITHVDAALQELRRIFLVEDFVDSLKFGIILWTFTYVGSWFNGLTLVIIGFIALFTLPKVYENNKATIDANLEIVQGKIAEITSKVKAAIPIGKKEEKKEQ